MEKTAKDLVNEFQHETGIRPLNKSLQRCVDFADVVLKMEEDAKKAAPTATNCMAYASMAEPGHTISHATFYNDKDLNAMMEWYLSKRKTAKPKTDKSNGSDEVNRLKIKNQKLEKQLKTLVKRVQAEDTLNWDLKRTKDEAIRSHLLCERMETYLKSRGLDREIDMVVTEEQINEYRRNYLNKPFVDIMTGEVLEDINSLDVDEQ